MTPRPPYDRTAQRWSWAELPSDVRARVEELVGGPVARVESAGGGFTPGFAGLVSLESGDEVFVKAASPEVGPWAGPSYRAEGRVLAVLPDGVPAPRLRWSAEVGEWILLGIEPVRGRMPGLPWNPADAASAVRACETAAAALHDAPSGLELPRLADDLGGEDPWRRWYGEVAGGVRETALLTPWARSALTELQVLLDDSPAAIDGDAACHGDLRPDNMIIDAAGTAWICDWNWLSLGAGWTDLAGLLVSVHADGLDADALLRSSWLHDGVDDAAVDAWLALIGAFMLAQAGDDPSASVSSWLGAHRAYFGTAALSWLEQRRADRIR